MHSLRNHNRSCVVTAMYLMKKYQWSLSKALEFLLFRKADLDIRKSVHAQLNVLETRLFKNGAPSVSWEVTPALRQ